MRTIEVAMLPELVETSLGDRVAVVIDVLRATTTVTWALAHGAECLFACETIDEARELAHQSQREVLLGGERGGERIPGFDLGNSPLDYTPDAIGGRQIAFTTTNGTRAMLRCREAKDILLAAFSNVSSVVDRLADVGQISIVCAGTDGAVTAEDVLLAGAISEALASTHAIGNDQGRLAIRAYQHAMQAGPLTDSLMQSQGGRNLCRLNRQADVELAAKRDCWDLVGSFCPETRRIQMR